MEVRIGAEVMGKAGPLGRLQRVLLDRKAHRLTDIVVRHGFPLGHERIVPFAHVTSAQGDMVTVDLDQHGLAAMPRFADARWYAPDPNFVGPGSFVERALAFGAQSAIAPPTLLIAFPGGAQRTPGDFEHPVLERGMPVVDAYGEKVGLVAHLVIEAESGLPAQITLRRGLLRHHAVDLPCAWVATLDEAGIVLNVPKARVAALALVPGRSERDLMSRKP